MSSRWQNHRSIDSESGRSLADAGRKNLDGWYRRCRPGLAIDISPLMGGHRFGRDMSIAGVRSSRIAGLAVGLSVLGMLFGTALVLSATYQRAGWLLFILSFGGWLGAALLALREGWHRGWFDH